MGYKHLYLRKETVVEIIFRLLAVQPKELLWVIGVVCAVILLLTFLAISNNESFLGQLGQFVSGMAVMCIAICMIIFAYFLFGGDSLNFTRPAQSQAESPPVSADQSGNPPLTGGEQTAPAITQAQATNVIPTRKAEKFLPPEEFYITDKSWVLFTPGLDPTCPNLTERRSIESIERVVKITFYIDDEVYTYMVEGEANDHFLRGFLDPTPMIIKAGDRCFFAFSVKEEHGTPRLIYQKVIPR